GVESTVPVESHHTPTNAPSTSQPPTSTPSMQTTYDTEEHATMPHDSPLLRFQSLRSVEGSLTLIELMVFCTKLSKRVEDFQSDLQQTKLMYGAAYTMLILKVKKLEQKVKTSQYKRRPRVRTSADIEILLDQEEPTELVEDLGSGEKGEKEISTIIPEQFAKEVSEKKDDSSSKPVGGSRKKTVAEKRIGAKLDEESAKRQKLKDVTEEEATSEYEKEKEELRLSLKIIHNDDSEERFQDHPLEGHDLLLQGDLRMIFDPDENVELWMNQLDWKLLRWKLHENYGVHTLFMDGALMEINMLMEKKYHLIKELLERMLNLQLEAEDESTMEFELIKFIKSLLKE
nr:hypothetical protein [Tanacetum cinerariifolium]